jgi:glycosyltransferase involved in cell wall biosynthesis
MSTLTAEPKTPLISVCLITYNHAPFLSQAIESILMQKHDYSWELIIADDNSTDATREIILRFKEKHPELIRTILREKNVGAFQNWRDMLNNARGKYIAYLEGDDYWTDWNKLNEQATFLEANHEYIGCFHNCEERFDNDDTRASFLYCSFPGTVDISFQDLIYSNVIPSCSMFYRNEGANKIPDWFRQLKMGDWPLHLLNTTIGKYKYIPKVMGVHRNHQGSTWMSLPVETANQYILEAYDVMIDGFSDKMEFQRKLIEARRNLMTPPKISFQRRCVNFIKRIQK